MKLISYIIVITVGSAVLFGCAKREPPPPETEERLEVIVDKDFVATIQETEEPYVFEISIQKVSKNPETGISGFPAIVDLTLKDSSGKVYIAEKWQDQQYAEEMDDMFSTARYPTEPLTGRVRLVRNDLPPGKYTIWPRVLMPVIRTIMEYPAGNSVEITLD